MVHLYKYYVSGNYPSSCLYFKTERFGVWILSPSSGKTYSGAIDRDSCCLQRDGDKIQAPKRPVLKYKQDGGLDRNRKMDNVQKPNVSSDVILSWEVLLIEIGHYRKTYMHLCAHVHYS
jgi:hypothetical protein